MGKSKKSKRPQQQKGNNNQG